MLKNLTLQTSFEKTFPRC